MSEPLKKDSMKPEAIKHTTPAPSDAATDNASPQALMADNLNHTPAAANTNRAPNAFEREEAQQATTTGRVKKTAGEQIYNRFTYQGVDWVANSALAITAAYVTSRTDWGRRTWLGEPMRDLIHNGITKHVWKNDPVKAFNRAELGRGFASIIFGGSVIIPPIMYLEKNKRNFVEKLDKRIYGEEEVVNNPRFEAAYQAIENEPKKGFWTGMLSRCVVLAPMIYAHVNHNKFMRDNLYYWAETPSKWISENTGFMQKLKGKTHDGAKLDAKAANEPVIDNYDFFHYNVGFDVSLTAIYSVAHEYSYKLLAGIFHKDKPANINEAPEQAGPTKDYYRSAADHLVAIDRTKSFELTETTSPENQKPDYALTDVLAHERVQPTPTLTREAHS